MDTNVDSNMDSNMDSNSDTHTVLTLTPVCLSHQHHRFRYHPGFRVSGVVFWNTGMSGTWEMCNFNILGNDPTNIFGQIFVSSIRTNII